jgi:UDP-glucuronate 4-epimerase
MNVLVTGGAGFIGGHVAARLLGDGHAVWVLDNFDPLHPPAQKREAVAELSGFPGFTLVEEDVRAGAALLEPLARSGLASGGVDAVVHLAALAGVRASIRDPARYADVNVAGTAAVLDLTRRLGASSFVFGSSSSVYGDAARAPFSEAEPADRPISPYAATKRAGELLAHSYSHLYGMGVVCLRFFTVYGPRQRPDLAIHSFARLLAAGRPIPFFGDGSSERDYTYVDDIVQGVASAVAYARAHPGCFELVNLGESDTVPLSRLVELLGEAMGVVPRLERLPPQPGDVQRTCADLTRARALLGYRPRTRIEAGIPRFVEWFRTTGAA